MFATGSGREAADLAEDDVRGALFTAWEDQTVTTRGHLASFRTVSYPRAIRTAGQPSEVYRYTATYGLGVRPPPTPARRATRAVTVAEIAAQEAGTPGVIARRVRAVRRSAASRSRLFRTATWYVHCCCGISTATVSACPRTYSPWTTRFSTPGNRAYNALLRSLRWTGERGSAVLTGRCLAAARPTCNSSAVKTNE